MSQSFPLATCLAVDVGFGNTKAVWHHTPTHDGVGQWAELCFRSVAPKIWGAEQSGLNTADRVKINVAGQQYWVGPGAHVTGVEDGVIEQSGKNIETPEYQALISGAWAYMIANSGTDQRSIDTLVLGLPVSGFKANRERLMQIGGKVFTVPLPNKTDISVVAKKVMVYPQPYGAFVTASRTNPSLTSSDRSVLVLDPGYSTMDWFLIENGQIRLEQCDSFEGGMSTLLAAVGTRISQDTGNGSPSFGLIEAGLRRGNMVIGKNRIDMGPYNAVIRQQADAVIREFLRRFEPARFGVTDIVLAGGAASYFEQSLSTMLPAYQIHCMKNSVMSNARGFYLAGIDK